MSLDKSESTLSYQVQHRLLLNALPVYVERDINGHPVNYSDKFGEECQLVRYNLYHGHAHGDGHADRILDHYLGCRDDSVKCSFSEEYMEFLRKERNRGVVAPVFSVRARLMRII
jgi:hypothetical protein